MPPYVGRGLSIGVGTESTWGTAVSRTVWFEGVSESMTRTVKKNGSATIAGGAGRGRRRHYIESDMAGGSIELLVTYEGMGILLQQITSATVATTGAGPYTHTYKTAATVLPGCTIEVVRGDGTAEVFEGCKVTKAAFKITAGGEMRCTLDVIAETSGGRVSAGTPSYTTSRDYVALHHQAGTFSWNAVAYTPRSVEFSIDNAYATRQLLGSKLTAEPKPSDFAKFNCKLELEWNSDALNTALTADTESDGAITFTSGAKTIAFQIHNAYIDAVSDPVNTVGVIAQSVSFVGQDDGTDLGFAVVVVNAQASGIAA